MLRWFAPLHWPGRLPLPELSPNAWVEGPLGHLFQSCITSIHLRISIPSFVLRSSLFVIAVGQHSWCKFPTCTGRLRASWKLTPRYLLIRLQHRQESLLWDFHLAYLFH